MTQRSHTIPKYNWSMTLNFLNSLDYLEGRDYTVRFTADAVKIQFTYEFQYTRYWSQWGTHIKVIDQL
jgi:hypothetical protein